MTSPVNPFAAPREERPAPPPPPNPDGQTQLIENRGTAKIAWDATFAGDRVWLTPSDGRAVISMNHAEFLDRAQLILGTLLKAVSIKTLEKSLVLMLDPAAIAAFRSWIQPARAEHMKRALKQRTRFSIPIGLLFVVGQLAAPEMSLLTLSFGIGIILVSVAGMLIPHAILFLFDAALWVLLALNNALWAYETGSVWSSVVCVMCVFFTIGSFRLWRFYR